MTAKLTNQPPLAYGVPIVEKSGGPTLQFQRLFNAAARNSQVNFTAAAKAQSTADGAVPQTRRINTTSPITGGGALSADLTIGHATSGVTAGTYGDATHTLTATVDADGHLTALSVNPISGAGTVTTTGTPTSGNLAAFSGATSITNGDLTGDVTTSGTLATTLAASGVTAGSYTNANITVDAKGRVTAASNGSGGSGSPGGTSGQIQYNNSGAFGGFTMGGDATVNTATGALTLAAGAVSLAKMANLAANSILGNNTGSAATPLALTGAQVTAMLGAFNSTLQGVVPASGGGTTNFLRADGTWAAPSGGGGSITIEDEGTSVGSASTINFTGSGVTATVSGGVATVDVPGGGGGGWTVVGSYDHSVTGDVANFDSSDLSGYDELWVQFDSVNSSSARVVLLLSTDGSTFYNTSGNYADIAGTGVTTSNVALFGNTTSTAAVRSSLFHIPDISDVLSQRYIFLPIRALTQVFLGSTAAIKKVRATSSNASGVAGGNITAGVITMLAR